MGRTSDARQRLMGAANDLIWEYSYGAVTVDAICERARVKKGSFYYFFGSKSDLASAAIEAWWAERAAVMNEIFDQGIPPLERLRAYFDFVVERQIQSYESTGHILGCPLHALATEICTQDERLRGQLHTVLKNLGGYLEQAIADAQALGHLEGDHRQFKAQALLAYYAGALTQARIANDPEALRFLSRDALRLIGAPAAALVKPAKPQPQLATLP
jgi:TetR/AcrR family transcriptional repressor of nem operon